jgi:hypothetical protein
VDDERPHGQDTAAWHQAIHWGNCRRKIVELFIGENAESVGTRQDTKRTIIGGRIVKMKTYGKNLFEGAGRSVCVVHAVLD